jgi:hypothetical protein
MIQFDKQFFDKHQSTLLKIANKWYLRWLLGLNRLPEQLKGKRIDLITPNSIHTIEGLKYTKKGKFKKAEMSAAFFTRPRFAEALAYNLSPVAYFQMPKNPVWRFSPVGFAYMLCLGFIGLKTLGIPFGWMGTTTDYYCGTGTGQIQNDRSPSTWSAVRDGTTGTFARYNAEAQERCTCYKNSTRFIIERVFLPTDTSGLPDDATISEADLMAKVQARYDNDNDAKGYIAAVETSQASNTALVVNDYNNVGSTAVSDTVDTTGATAESWITFSLTAGGLALISKTGYTKLGLREGHDLENEEISNSGSYAGVSVYTNYVTGTSSDPYLSITYSAGAASFIPKVIMF